MRKMFGHDDIDDEQPANRRATMPMNELRHEGVSARESLPPQDLPQDLEAVLLQDFEDPTIAAICERFGVTVRAAKARLRRGRLLVRVHLVGSDPPDAAPVPRADAADRSSPITPDHVPSRPITAARCEPLPRNESRARP